MGMPVTLDAPGGGGDEAFEAAFAELRRIDGLFSPFIPESAVSRIAAGTLLERDAGPLVDEVLGLCRSFETETCGWFSAWASGRLDPCGLVKGWAIERASKILADAGLRDHVVDGAGDVRAAGRRSKDRPWRIGVRRPWRRDSVVAVIAGSDLAVATSGTYEKGAHVLDPHTRAGATELVSVTVVGTDLITADAYATAVLAAGWRGLGIVERARGYEALAIDAEERMLATSGLEPWLVA